MIHARLYCGRHPKRELIAQWQLEEVKPNHLELETVWLCPECEREIAKLKKV